MPPPVGVVQQALSRVLHTLGWLNDLRQISAHARCANPNRMSARRS
jgi:hypothetical protein